jgi:chromosomal replication initiation ATPase DnaA
MVYLYGPPGSGRSTLALAYARSRGKAVRVLTGSLLTLRYEENRQKGTLHQFLEALRDPELLVIDAMEHVDLRQQGPVLTGMLEERLHLGRETVVVGVEPPSSLEYKALGNLLGRGLLIPLNTPTLEDFSRLSEDTGVPMEETTLAQLVDAVHHHLGLFLSVLRSYTAQHGRSEENVPFASLQPFLGKS